MARFIYEWKPTEHGRRLFRRPNPAAARRTSKPAQDYSSLLKPELVKAAHKRRIDSSGTKADIIARLEASDG